jgi:hypothetical protein
MGDGAGRFRTILSSNPKSVSVSLINTHDFRKKELLLTVRHQVECLTWTHYNILQIICNISTDLLIMSIPITIVRDLRMPLMK